MGDRNLVSIIIPCFNAEPYLRETLDCALAQTYRPLEIILVDDNSTDRSLEIGQSRAPSIKVIRNESRRGVTHTRNTGLHHARGTHLQFLDSDDLIARDKIERQAAVLDADPGCDVVFSEVHEFQDRLEDAHSEAWREHKQRQDPLAAFLVVNAMAIHAPLIRRSCVDRANGFSADFPFGGEDWDFWIRVCLQGSKFTFLPGVFAFYRKHSGSLCSSTSNLHHWEQFVLSRAMEHLRANNITDTRRWHALALGLTRLAVQAQWQGNKEEAARLFRSVQAIRPPLDADWEQHSLSEYGARMSTSHLGLSLVMLQAGHQEAAARLLALSNAYLTQSQSPRPSAEKALGLRFLREQATIYRQRTGHPLRELADCRAWAAEAAAPSMEPLESARLLDGLGYLEMNSQILSAAARVSERSVIRSLLRRAPNPVSGRREWLLLRARQLLVRTGLPELSVKLASLGQSRAQARRNTTGVR